MEPDVTVDSLVAQVVHLGKRFGQPGSTVQYVWPKETFCRRPRQNPDG